MKGYWPTEPRSVPLEELGWVKTLYLGNPHWHGDPTIVWGTTVQTDAIEQFIVDQRREAGAMISIAHILVWIVGQALHKHSALNRRIIWRRVYPYVGVSVTLPIMETRSGEVDSLYLRDIERMTVQEISRAVWEKARDASIRSATEQKNGAKISLGQRWKKWFKLRWIHRMSWLGFFLTDRWRLPTYTIDEINGCSAFVNYLGFAGAPPMIAYKPSSLPSHSWGVNVTMGPTEQKPVVVDGAVTVRNVAPIFVRLDHRIANGYQIAAFLNTIRDYMQNPSTIVVRSEKT